METARKLPSPETSFLVIEGKGEEQPFGPISPEEYLRFEEAAEIKHEYVAGYVYAMSGVTKRHNTINLNLYVLLREAAQKKNCQVFVAEVKLYLRFGNKHFYYYPDLVVSCDPDDRDPLLVERPCLIAEISSPSTARIDRLEKFFLYTQIPSLKEYLILSQDRPEAIVYRRSRNWEEEVYSRPEDRIRLDCLEVEIPLSELYAGLPEEG